MKIFAFGSSIVSSYWNGAATYYRGCYKYLARLGEILKPTRAFTGLNNQTVGGEIQRKVAHDLPLFPGYSGFRSKRSSVRSSIVWVAATSS